MFSVQVQARTRQGARYNEEVKDGEKRREKCKGVVL